MLNITGWRKEQAGKKWNIIERILKKKKRGFYQSLLPFPYNYFSTSPHSASRLQQPPAAASSSRPHLPFQ